MKEPCLNAFQALHLDKSNWRQEVTKFKAVNLQVSEYILGLVPEVDKIMELKSNSYSEDFRLNLPSVTKN